MCPQGALKVPNKVSPQSAPQGTEKVHHEVPTMCPQGALKVPHKVSPTRCTKTCPQGAGAPQASPQSAPPCAPSHKVPTVCPTWPQTRWQQGFPLAACTTRCPTRCKQGAPQGSKKVPHKGVRNDYGIYCFYKLIHLFIFIYWLVFIRLAIWSIWKLWRFLHRAWACSECRCVSYAHHMLCGVPPKTTSTVNSNGAVCPPVYVNAAITRLGRQVLTLCKDYEEPHLRVRFEYCLVQWLV